MMNDEQKKVLEEVKLQLQKEYQQRKKCYLPGVVKEVQVNNVPVPLAVSPKWEGNFDFRTGFLTSELRYDPIVNPDSGELNAGFWMGDLCALMDIEQQLELASWLLNNSAVGIKMADITNEKKDISRFNKALKKHLENIQNLDAEFNKYQS